MKVDHGFTIRPRQATPSRQRLTSMPARTEEDQWNAFATSRRTRHNSQYPRQAESQQDNADDHEPHAGLRRQARG